LNKVFSAKHSESPDQCSPTRRKENCVVQDLVDSLMILGKGGLGIICTEAARFFRREPDPNVGILANAVLSSSL
jgi:hypothetical protein